MAGVKEEGGNTMKIEKGIKTGMFLGLLAMVVLTITMSPAEVKAAWTGSEICAALGAGDTTTDTDRDGIPDYYECNGFNLAGDLSLYCGYNVRSTCASNNRSQYLDPSASDLFVILKYAPSGSLLSGIPDLLKLISDVPLATGGGLGTTTHIITDAQVVQSQDPALDRNLSNLFAQKAVRNAEDASSIFGTTVDCRSISSSAVVLGSTSTGVTPNTPGIASTIYSKRVQTWLNNVCACKTYCYDNATQKGKTAATPTGLPNLINWYQKENIVHEIGHMIGLAPDNIAITHHYISSDVYTPYNGDNTGAGSIMEQSVFFKVYKSPSQVVFYIPSKYDASDPSNMILK